MSCKGRGVYEYISWFDMTLELNENETNFKRFFPLILTNQ